MCILHDQSPQTLAPKWLIVAHSAIGRQHIKNHMPCQDAHWLAMIDSEIGVAVVCDGAGSAKESQLGARLVAKKVAILFKNRVADVNWSLPSDIEKWRSTSHQILLKTAAFLRRFAEKTHREFKALACTVIVVIYSPHGMLICHIGDGRAAVCDSHGEWRAAMRPFKGEEANETMFITSASWQNDPALIGCGLINESMTAFVLMSDGCESHAFQLNRYDQETGLYIQLNEPYVPFFKSLVEQLLTLYRQGCTSEQLNQEWQAFIEQGTPGLLRETDDKTMILGILKP